MYQSIFTCPLNFINRPQLELSSRCISTDKDTWLQARKQEVSRQGPCK